MSLCKKVAAIHDLSGVGRCSLTVILPALSSMGIQVCPVPTALLSAHTQGFGNIVMKDFTDYIDSALDHYKELEFKFDCVYTGFLASDRQVDSCLNFFNAYKDSLKIVDPVMGDNGKLYSTYTKKLCDRVSELVSVADVITPNLTEASILLGEKYPECSLTAEKVKEWLVRLADLGPKLVVVTSVDMENGKRCNVGFDKSDNTFWVVENDYVPVHYPGTGDLFASVLIGGILKDLSLPESMCLATKFTELCVKTTYKYNTAPREGVMLEACLGWLGEDRKLVDYKML